MVIKVVRDPNWKDVVEAQAKRRPWRIDRSRRGLLPRQVAAIDLLAAEREMPIYQWLVTSPETRTKCEEDESKGYYLHDPDEPENDSDFYWSYPQSRPREFYLAILDSGDTEFPLEDGVL